MDLRVITEDGAEQILNECLDECHPTAFISYIRANIKASADAFQTYGTMPKYHELLEKISDNSGMHSYLIIHKIAKQHSIPW